MTGKQRAAAAGRGVLGVRLAIALVLGGVSGLLLLPTPVLAQSTASPVQTQAQPLLTGDASGTITTTNSFQQIWPQASLQQPRRGCLVVNNSTDRQWVFFGPTPTKATAIPLEPATATSALGGWVSCASGAGGALQDQVWITGTSGDTFVAKQQ